MRRSPSAGRAEQQPPPCRVTVGLSVNAGDRPVTEREGCRNSREYYRVPVRARRKDLSMEGTSLSSYEGAACMAASLCLCLMD